MAISDFIFDPLRGLGQTLSDGLSSSTAQNLGQATKDAVNKLTQPETKSWADKQRALQTNYNYEVLKYPSDVGDGSRHPYFMTFYILQQDLSKFKKEPSQGPAPLSTADINARSTRTLAKNIHDTKIGFGRKTHRTSSAIRLYMPDTLSWSFRNEFRDVNISGLPGVGLASAIASLPALHNSMTQSHQDGTIMGLLASLDSPAMRSASGPLVELAGAAIPGLGETGALSVIGVALNPQVDVIYESPTLREFTFDFLFAPRDANEAQAVQDIVKQFKFHASPEMLGGGVGFGRYFVPPSEFDIEFSVSTIGKISSCVLQNITVDYAPNGTAFYKDDRPVYTRMTLQFRELEFITKELVNRGF
jgi:hypothetical protein